VGLKIRALQRDFFVGLLVRGRGKFVGKVGI